MTIENVIITKRGATWHVTVHGGGYVGEGEAEHLADAIKTAVNNLLMYLRLQRSD